MLTVVKPFSDFSEVENPQKFLQDIIKIYNKCFAEDILVEIF